jgi:osmotically-inducible protein OsmY
VERGLSPELASLHEAMRAGEKRLWLAGAPGAATMLEEAVNGAVARLQKLYDQMVDRLKRRAAAAAAAAAAARAASKQRASVYRRDSEAEQEIEENLWQHDGGYQRIRRTLETVQALQALIQTAPWHTSAKYVSICLSSIHA